MRPLYNISLREWHRMTSRRLYLGVCLVLPLFSLFFMATIFGNGQMENIPVGIVDQDNTVISRSISRRISAVPTFRVTAHFADEAAARRAVQRKEIYGYLVIPPRFEEKIVTGGPGGAEGSNAPGAPTLTYYYHYALLSVGGELMAAFENSLAPVALSPIIMKAEALGVGQEQMRTFLLPVEGSTHPLYNPDMDYSIYLSQPFFYILFQILILLVTVYAMGSELKFGTAAEWLRASIPAGKDPTDLRQADILTAVAGKLLPYTLIFSSIGILANYVLFGPLHIPFHGSLWLMNFVTILFIIATQALAVLIFSVFPKLSYIISVVSMVGSLGATLSGVTFPVTAMYKPVHAASYLFPVRHFTEAAQAMIYFDAGLGYFWQSVAILFLFPLLALLILPLLKYWIGRFLSEPRSENSEGAEDILPCLSLSGIIRHEWRAIATNQAILLVLSGGIFLYGLLYNYMYAPNLVRKAPLVVVDHSHSALSREYIRWLDATPQTSVRAQTPDILEARRWVKQGEVAGILYLPSDFETRVARGETSVFILYAATDAFLKFKDLQESSSRVMLAVNDAHRAEGAVFLPPQGLLAVATSAPVNVRGTALYNYTEGYGSYLIPAVLIVIIFQTMLMVISMLTGEEAEKRRRTGLGGVADCLPRDSRRNTWRNAVRIVSGRTFVYVMLYAVFALFLLGLLPHIFSIPHIGNTWNIITLMIPFLLGTSFFGLAVSRWFTDSDAPLLMIAFFSVGYIFLSGVSYPLELMPWYWQAVHYIFPVAPAVLAFVKLNSMGASLADIQPQMLVLWIQVIVYGLLAVYTAQGLAFDNKERVCRYIRNIGYYRLSAYFYPFLETPKDRQIFKQGSSFDAAIKLYRFDKKLRLFMFNEIEKIEVSLRSTLANVVAKETGNIFWMTDSSLFANPNKFSRTMELIDKEVNNSKEDFILHFKHKYSNAYPSAWMLVEILPMGVVTRIYENIKSNPLKKKIAAYYDLPVPVFTSWLTVITLARNSCCHHARVWNRQYAINPMVARKMKRPWISDAVPPHRTFYEICIIKWFIDIISPHNDMKQHFKSLLEQYPSVDYKAIGIPQNWLYETLWKTYIRFSILKRKRRL